VQHHNNSTLFAAAQFTQRCDNAYVYLPSR
jgi:hypothetical protein